MKRIVSFADRHPWMVIWGLVVFVLVIMAGSFTFFIKRENHQNANEEKARIEAVQAEAKARAEALAASNLDVCRRAVTAVTDQLNADLLKVVKTIEDRLTEQSRPIPAVYLQLELLISNRQPPLAACEPKGTP